MDTREIGKRIVKIRKLKGLTQEDMANFMQINRSSFAQIETGNRNISAIELKKIADYLGYPIERLLAKKFNIEKISHSRLKPDTKQEIRISVPKLKVEKLKNVLLYILEKCAGKPNVGETVLYKLLYFSDFNFYELNEEHLTGVKYRKLPYGPLPTKLDIIINNMIETRQLKRIKTEYHGYPQIRYIPLIKSDLNMLKASEKEIIDNVIEHFSDWSAAAISEYSHKDMPWKATEEGEEIDYELAFYREVPYSVRMYDDEPEQP
ncbi:hypothetical protein ES708_15661 [subsurface metagenome]